MAKVVPKQKRPRWISTPDSEAIEGFGYSSARRELAVRFRHGLTYTYLKVPQRAFDEMCDAPSRGAYVAELKKRYAWELRLEGPE